MNNFFDKKIGRLAFAINFVICTILLTIINVFGNTLNRMEYSRGGMDDSIWLVYVLVWLFVVFWAVLATTFRLHDIGRSRYWAWLFIIPFGNLVLAVWCLFCKSDGYHKE